MSQELLYTSSQKGLDPTKRGFCTVLATAGMPSNLSGQLERLSGYKHHFPAGSDEAHQNPVAFSHVTLRINGRVTSVLSRVSDYKLDYSGRSNKLAHHVVLDHSERCDAGPAWLLQQHDLMRTEWDGECKNVTHGPIIPMGDQRPALCRTWENVTGDAGHAGQIADAVQQSHKPIWIIYSLSQANQLLDLLNEVIALVPYDERWNTTFSTFFGQDSPDVSCKIRCVVENSDLARMAPSKGIVFSLTHPKSITNPTPAILAARGVESPAVSFEPNILPSSTESIDQIDSSPHFDSSPAPTVNKEQSPPPLPSTTQKRERATSREPIATAAIVSPRPVGPPPPREFQQKIKSSTNRKVIVLTSVVTAAVVTLIFSAGITAYVWLGPNSKAPLAQNTDTESTETGVELDLSTEQPLQSSTGSATSSSAEDSVESTDNAEDRAPSGKDKPPTTETTSNKEDSTADAASDAEDKKEIDNDSPAPSKANADAKKPPAKDAKNADPENSDTDATVMTERPNDGQQIPNTSDDSPVNKDTTAKKTVQNQSPPQQDTTTVSGQTNRDAKIFLYLRDLEKLMHNDVRKAQFAFEYFNDDIRSIEAKSFYICRGSNPLLRDRDDPNTRKGNFSRLAYFNIHPSEDTIFFALDQNIASWNAHNGTSKPDLDIQLSYSRLDGKVFALFGFEHDDLQTKSFPSELAAHMQLLAETDKRSNASFKRLLQNLPLPQQYRKHLASFPDFTQESLGRRMREFLKEKPVLDPLDEELLNDYVKLLVSIDSHLSGNRFDADKRKNFESKFNSFTGRRLKGKKPEEMERARAPYEAKLKQIQTAIDAIMESSQQLEKSRDDLIATSKKELVKINLDTFNIQIKTRDRGGEITLDFDKFRGTFILH